MYINNEYLILENRDFWKCKKITATNVTKSERESPIIHCWDESEKF